jgi:hypothetical protein
VELGGIGGGAALLWCWGPALADMGIEDGGDMAEEWGREAGRILADGLREAGCTLAEGWRDAGLMLADAGIRLAGRRLARLT